MGVHVVAAACNQDNDVRYYSPARVDSVITVGASTFTDSRAWFSNKGALADIYAPGVFITSATHNPNHPNVCYGFCFLLVMNSPSDKVGRIRKSNLELRKPVLMFLGLLHIS